MTDLDLTQLEAEALAEALSHGPSWSDLHTLAAACFEGDRPTAALILSLSSEPAAMFARLDTSSKLTLIGWGLHRRLAEMRASTASH